jgi:hypothetical protein
MSKTENPFKKQILYMGYSEEATEEIVENLIGMRD